jgi:hypothetical protein
MLAVEARDEEVILYLLERGADPTLRDKAGETALNIATRIKAERIAEIIRLDISLHPPAAEYYAHKNPKVSIVCGQHQKGKPGYLMGKPLLVLIKDENGAPLPNAPVKFKVNPDEGYLVTAPRSPMSESLILRTDQDGKCGVYFSPSEKKKHFLTRISAIAEKKGNPGEAIFEEYAGDANTRAEGSVFYTSGGGPAQLNSDGSVDVSWENNTDEAVSINIFFNNADGKWIRCLTVPPDATSAHIPP